MSPQLWGWIGFNLFVLAMLALDLGVFNRRAHHVHVREALGWSAMWIALALLFNLGIYLFCGPQKGLEFLTGYLIEKSLSMDNIFVFLLVFSYFRVPPKYQHKVLFWGILGALVLRVIFIFAGVALIQKFTWTVYIFGVFLIFTGLKMAFQKETEIHPERNILIRLVRRVLPVSESDASGRFFVRQNGKLFATPLFVVMIFVETTDLIFAVDSIPAILAISHDPFIIYTSNVFAILGLRALYFALAGALQYFHHLHYGLAAILSFVGAKMLLTHTSFKIPTGLSLGVIAALLALSIATSFIWPKKEAPEAILTPSDSDAKGE